MTLGTNWNIGTPDADFDDYAAHDAAQQQAWREQYIAAAELARTAAFYQAAQAVIIAGIQAAAADNAADKQYDIANRQMIIAEEEYQRYKDRFWCNEHKLADEACEVTVPTPDYVIRADRSAADVRRSFDQARRKLARSRSRYCMADFTRAMCDLDAVEAKTIAQTRDASYRYEEERVRVLDDTRFNRALQVANIGRGIQATQLATYQSAMQLANESIATRLGGINNLLGAVSGGLSGVIRAQYNYNAAQAVAASPFHSSYATTPSIANNHPYNFNYGGPAPMGAGAGAVGGTVGGL